MKSLGIKTEFITTLYTFPMYVKDFGNWNIRKKDLDRRTSRPPFFKEKEVWWLSIGVNIGYEEDGKGRNFARPVLILRKFNNQLFLGIPLSTKTKANIYYIEFVNQNKKNSL